MLSVSAYFEVKISWLILTKLGMNITFLVITTPYYLISYSQHYGGGRSDMIPTYWKVLASYMALGRVDRFDEFGPRAYWDAALMEDLRVTNFKKYTVWYHTTLSDWCYNDCITYINKPKRQSSSFCKITSRGPPLGSQSGVAFVKADTVYGNQC